MAAQTSLVRFLFFFFCDAVLGSARAYRTLF